MVNYSMFYATKRTIETLSRINSDNELNDISTLTQLFLKSLDIFIRLSYWW